MERFRQLYSGSKIKSHRATQFPPCFRSIWFSSFFPFGLCGVFGAERPPFPQTTCPMIHLESC